ncbi:hypothetical protein ACJX0J_007869, partial [Zea mays]
WGIFKIMERQDKASDNLSTIFNREDIHFGLKLRYGLILTAFYTIHPQQEEKKRLNYFFWAHYYWELNIIISFFV